MPVRKRPIHCKGVLILSGFLARPFTQHNGKSAEVGKRAACGA